MSTPIASVLMPCWNTASWIDAALDSILESANRFALQEIEIICVDDGSTDGTAGRLSIRAQGDVRIRVITQANQGVSVARNVALKAARGTYIFWLDPDDVVAPDFLSAGVAAMEKTSADWCVFPYRMRRGEQDSFKIMPLKGDYRFTDKESIIAGYISRIIGYSFKDLYRWFAGEELFSPRELGAVWRCVYRREIIERYQIRFDEKLKFWEDAIFNCEYLLHITHTTTIDHPLYDYTLRNTGWTARGECSPVRVENKFSQLNARKRLDNLAQGKLITFFAGSCVLAPIEILVTFRRTGIGLVGAIRATRLYLRDPMVKQSVRSCPLSWRKPLFGLAVLGLRVLAL